MISRTGARGGSALKAGRGVGDGVRANLTTFSRKGASGLLRRTGLFSGVTKLFMMTRFLTRPTSPAFYTSPTNPNRLRISHAKNLDLGRVDPRGLGNSSDEGVLLCGQLIWRK